MTQQNTNTPARKNVAMPSLPSTAAVKLMAERLFRKSGYNNSVLNSVGVVPGSTTQFQLTNTGLVEKLVINIQGQIALKNTAGAGQAVQLAPEFPLNVVSNISIKHNGNVDIISCSPYELMGMLAKRYKKYFVGSSAGAAFDQALLRISAKKATIAGDANAVLHAGNGLTGYDYVTIGAGVTGVVSWDFNIEIPFVFRRDLPIGLLALQNNSIVAQCNLTAPQLLGINALSPFYVAGAIPATLSIDPAGSTFITANPTQFYWETPSDKTLYDYFVANSYFLVSVPGQQLNAGVKGLSYTMPLNYILTAMLFTIRNSTHGLVNVPAGIDNFGLNYNNTTTVGVVGRRIREYLQEIFYEGSPTGLGQLLWDACIFEGEGNNLGSDTAFLDLYQANNPQFFADVAATVTTPGTFSALREMIVPAQIKPQ